MEKDGKRKLIGFIGMFLGTIVNYLFGTAWFCFVTDTGILPALIICVAPFVIGDIIKIIVALSVAPIVARRLEFGL